MSDSVQSSSDFWFKLLVCFYGVFLAIGSFLLYGTVGINLADEGFLWYGAQRTFAGEIPLRDFQAYEPARYYWIAGCMKLLGSNGLFPFRASLALFQAIGMAVAILLVSESTKNKFLVFLSGPIFLLWMITPFKFFENVSSILLVGAAYLVLTKPTKKFSIIAGIIVGFCAVLGRNLGLYGFVSLFAALSLSLFVHKESRFIQIFLRFGFGILIGLSPAIGLILFAPGYWDALVDSVRFFIHLKSTNLPLPVPYPWTMNFSGGLKTQTVRDLGVNTFFVLMPLFAVIGVLLVLRRPRALVSSSPLFVASVLVLHPFLHYAFSRADFYHLGCIAHPFLIGLFALPDFIRVSLRYGIITVLLILSWIGIKHHNQYFGDTDEWVQYRIGNHNYLVSKENENYLETFRRAAELAGPRERVFVAPHWPAAYAILGQKTPTWESYFTVAQPEPVQERAAQGLIADPPKVAIIRNHPMDGREELRFRNTHPLLWKYISENYRPYPMADIHPEVTIFVPKDFPLP